MKTLLIDIETKPHKAYCWGLFDQRIGLNQIVEPGGTLCWAAKWLGDPSSKIMFGAEWDGTNTGYCTAVPGSPYIHVYSY